MMPVCFGALQGMERFTLLAASSVIGAVLKVVFALVFVRAGMGVNGALVGMLLASLAVFSCVIVSVSWALRKCEADRDVTLVNIRSVFGPTLLILGCFTILCYIDVPLVKHFFTAAEAGAYSRAAVIGKAFLFVPMALASAMFPKVAALEARKEDTRPLLAKTLFWSSLLLALGMTVCFLGAEFIYELLTRGKDVTRDYHEVVVFLLKVFGIAIAPFALCNVLIYYNLARHRLGIAYMLLGGVVLQVAAISALHSRLTLAHVVLIMGLCGWLMLALMLGYSYGRKRGREVRG